ERRVREIYGADTVIVPYVMPGFDLARHCARRFAAEARPGTIGMVLVNHGIFSFGATARASYARMIALVARNLRLHRLPGRAGRPFRPEISRLRAPRRRGADLAARAGDPGSRDPHQARADAGPRRHGLYGGLPPVLR